MKIIRQKTVKNRKSHMCHACGRTFKKGETMDVMVYSENRSSIETWRECATCHELLTNHIDIFSDPSDDYIVYQFCVENTLSYGMTPEDLLKELESEIERKKY